MGQNLHTLVHRVERVVFRQDLILLALLLRPSPSLVVRELLRRVM